MKQSVRELLPEEQIRMTLDEAGDLYNGYYIHFTNSEEKWEKDGWVHYVVPRIIALNVDDYYDSGLFKKYQDREKYGVPCDCAAFMTEENMPPILAF